MASSNFSTMANTTDSEITGFKRLTSHYKERKTFEEEETIKTLEAEMTFNHLPTGIRFLMFLNRRKLRFLFVLALGAYFSYWGNFVGIGTSRIERLFKKYKKRLTFKYNHEAMTEPNAVATLYEPTKMSR